MTETRAPKSVGDHHRIGALEALVVWKLGWLRPALGALAVAIGAATALSAAWIAFLAFRDGESMVGMFEAVALVAGVFVSLIALGKFREGAGVALAACALAIGGGALLNEPSIAARFFHSRLDPVVIGGTKILWIMVARVVAAVLVLVYAGVVVWSRNPRASAWYLVRAKLVGVPIVAVAAGAALIPSVRQWIESWPSVVSAIAAVVVFFVMLVGLSAAGHCFIRSLEVGKLDDAGNPDRTGSDAARAAA